MIKDIKVFQKIGILLVATMAFWVFSGFSVLLAQNGLEQEINFVRQVPIINDDFADNRVIVTLKQAHSDVNKEIDVASFKTATSKGTDGILPLKSSKAGSLRYIFILEVYTILLCLNI